MNNKCSQALEGQNRSLFYSNLTLGQYFKTLKYKALKLPALCHFNFPKQCQQPLFTVTHTKSLVPCHISLWIGQVLNQMAELFWHWGKPALVVPRWAGLYACPHVSPARVHMCHLLMCTRHLLMSTHHLLAAPRPVPNARSPLPFTI